jgi:alkylhydroperoxidase family enzyme
MRDLVGFSGPCYAPIRFHIKEPSMTRTRVSLYWRATLVATAALSLAANFYFIRDVHAQRLMKPRIPPVAKESWTDDQREFLVPYENLGALNIGATIANHPELAKNWQAFSRYILRGNTLPARDREMLILRIGWLCRSEYEWAQHVRIGRRDAGLTDDDLAHIMKGPDATGVSAHDKLLLVAATELRNKAFISDETWSALAQTYDTRQMMDIVFTVGQYNLVSMAINSFGVQLEPGLTGFPPGTR